MKVEIIAATPNSVTACSKAAGTSYGKNDRSLRRLEHCARNGHMSVFEHACVTFRIEGISRACSHQLVRHRLASFVQESQRYCKIDTKGNDWFVRPRAFARETDSKRFCSVMRIAAMEYRLALSSGIKPEDARYLLPEATKTNITMTMNVRELFHFLNLRLDKAAQWEIKQLAKELRKVIQSETAWEDLMALRTLTPEYKMMNSEEV